MLKRLRPKSEFGLNVAKLMTGTGIGQIVPIAFSPILTRLFSPEDFGLLALYIAVTSILGIVACGRYELAIMLPEREEDSANILALSIMIALGLGALTLGAISLWHDEIAQMLGNEDIASWLFLVPVSLILTGCYQSFNYWLNRKKEFGTLAKSRVLQSGSIASSQVAIGSVKPSVDGGLIVGNILGQFMTVVYFVIKCLPSLKKVGRDIDRHSMSLNARRYKKFPLYSSWGSLCDTTAVQIPVIVISRSFGASIIGLFSFTFKILSLPFNLIATSISQVMLAKAVEMAREQPEALAPYILKIFFILCIVVSPMIVVMQIWGEPLFAFVFGEKWRQAGDFAGMLSLAVAARFTVSPLSAVLILEHHIARGVAWQVFYLITISLTLFSFASSSIDVFLVAFVLHEIALYTIYFAVIYYAASRPLDASENSEGNIN